MPYDVYSTYMQASNQANRDKKLKRRCKNSQNQETLKMKNFYKNMCKKSM